MRASLYERSCSRFKRGASPPPLSRVLPGRSSRDEVITIKALGKVRTISSILAIY